MKSRVLIIIGFLVLISIFTINSAFALNQEQSDSKDYEFVLDRCINPVDFRVGHIFENATHYIDTMDCILFEKRMIKGPDNETAEKRIIENLPNFLKSPLKQIKSGVTLIDVKCNEGKVKVIKYNRMSVACVSEETQIELWERGWATMRFHTEEETSAHALCNNYEGKWHPEYEGCRGITDLQCSLMGGEFVDDLKICYNEICPVDKTYTLCVTNLDLISGELILDLDAMIKAESNSTEKMESESIKKYKLDPDFKDKKEKANEIFSNIPKTTDSPFLGIVLGDDRKSIEFGVDITKLTDKKNEEYYLQFFEENFSHIDIPYKVIFQERQGGDE